MKTKCTNCGELAECRVGGTGESICARCQSAALEHGHYNPAVESATCAALAVEFSRLLVDEIGAARALREILKGA